MVESSHIEEEWIMWEEPSWKEPFFSLEGSLIIEKKFFSAVSSFCNNIGHKKIKLKLTRKLDQIWKLKTIWKKKLFAFLKQTAPMKW